MKYLIVAATDSEITSDKIKLLPTLITGAGMVNTSINLTKELIQNHYDLVINVGVAGSFCDNIKIGDVVEVNYDIFSELGFENNFDFNEFIDFSIKTHYFVESKTNLKQVKGITVNTVHGNEKSIIKIIDRLSPDIETMEGAAVFKVCEEMQIPCIQIRSISNKVEQRNKDNWDMPLAIFNLNSELDKIIDSL